MKIKIGSDPSYGESSFADVDLTDMSECYLADLLNEQHKPIDNEEEQA